MQNDHLMNELITLRPGKSVVYFVGFLDMDRGAAKIAALAAQLARQGKVILTQRRLGAPVKDGIIDWHAGVGPGFEYIATGVTREEKWFDPKIK
jgi:hypothetical protein